MTKRQRIMLIVPMAAGLLVFVAVFALYHTLKLNMWIYSKEEGWEPYPVYLIKEGENLSSKGTPEEIGIYQTLIAELSRIRHLRTLSATGIRFNLLDNRAYLKAYMETSLTSSPEKTQRLKQLCTFRKKSSRWVLDSVENLYIE